MKFEIENQLDLFDQFTLIMVNLGFWVTILTLEGSGIEISED